MPTKQIDIRKQPRLSFARTFRLTINGIKYRLFRSAVTMAVITVAIAFLMNSATEGLVKSAVKDNTEGRIQALQMAPRWASYLTAPGSDEVILTSVATGTYLVGEAPADSVQGTAAIAATVLTYFNDLQYGHRRQLIHNRTGLDIFAYLATDEGRERFDAGMSVNKSLSFPLTGDELTAFLADWPNALAAVNAERDARKAAIAQISKSLDDRTPMEALTDATGDFGEVIRAAGYELDAETAATLVRQSHDILDRRRLEGTMSKLELKKKLAARYDVLPSEVSGLYIWDKLGGSAEATAYVGICKDLELGLELSPERIVELSKKHKERSVLLRAERLSAGVGGGPLGLGERMTWLLMVSMLVCGVGIANAMLMTVTERFREIATLKCLGALDFFIMLMFVLEASLLGLIGGFFGAILGLILGFARMLGLYGTQAVTSAQPLEMFVAILVAMGVGLILAVLAAVYPSFKAARLAPMEAMRIE